MDVHDNVFKYEIAFSIWRYYGGYIPKLNKWDFLDIYVTGVPVQFNRNAQEYAKFPSYRAAEQTRTKLQDLTYASIRTR